MIVRFADIPELRASRFTPNRSCFWKQVPQPAHLDLASGLIRVDDDYWIVGRCTSPPGQLMHERIADWYRERHAERAAKGTSQPIPLAVVLACHDQGIAAFVSSQLVKAAAQAEDKPGPQVEQCE